MKDTNLVLQLTNNHSSQTIVLSISGTLPEGYTISFPSTLEPQHTPFQYVEIYIIYIPNDHFIQIFTTYSMICVINATHWAQQITFEFRPPASQIGHWFPKSKSNWNCINFALLSLPYFPSKIYFGYFISDHIYTKPNPLIQYFPNWGPQNCCRSHNS